MNTRNLGILCMACIAGSIIASLLGLAFGVSENNVIADELLVIGALVGLIGMIQANAVGSNPVVRALAFLPILALMTIIVTDIARLFDPMVPHYAGTYFGLMGGMILASILTIAAKTWQGWRRFVPLFILVMFFIISIAVAGDPSPFPGNIRPYLRLLTGDAPWALLGYAVATAEPAAAQGQSATA